jgi:hypothetical protein
MTERKIKYGTVETKACPIASTAGAGTGCIRERCALWFDGNCAFVVIAKSLRSPVAVKDVTPVAGL